jgi:MFS family permease
VGALVVGLELASSHPEGPWTLLSVVSGTAALGSAVLWMLRAANPLFDLTVFSTRTFRATNSGGFIYRLTISAVPFLLPLMFQEGFGWSPLHAGIMVAAVFIGNIGIKPATTPLIRRFGFKPVLVFASLASAVTFALCALLDERTPEPLIFALLVCSGAFRSIGFSAYASVQYADIVPAQLTSANAVSATLVQLSTGAGIAVGALLLRVFDSAPLLASGIGGVLGASPDTGMAPYRGAFLSIALLMLLSTADSLMLHRHAGAEVSRPGRAPAAERPRRRPA